MRSDASPTNQMGRKGSECRKGLDPFFIRRFITMKGLSEWLKRQNGPLLEAGAGKVILVLTASLVAAKLLPEWAQSAAEFLVVMLGWI